MEIYATSTWQSNLDPTKLFLAPSNNAHMDYNDGHKGKGTRKEGCEEVWTGDEGCEGKGSCHCHLTLLTLMMCFM